MAQRTPRLIHAVCAALAVTALLAPSIDIAFAQDASPNDARQTAFNGDCSDPTTLAPVSTPLRWSEDASWKLDYNNIAQMSPEELARRRAEFDRQKEIARGNRAA